VQWDCANNNDNQKWRIEPVGAGLYKLLAMHSGKALTIGNNNLTSGEKTIQWDYLNEGGQKWKIEASGSSYRLVASHSNQCLEVQSASSADGAQVQQAVCSGTPAQQFKLKAQF
jgi:Ricin-type beta-trefoil lectin domain-like